MSGVYMVEVIRMTQYVPSRSRRELTEVIDETVDDSHALYVHG
jgi:hypothetical protein